MTGSAVPDAIVPARPRRPIAERYPARGMMNSEGSSAPDGESPADYRMV